MVQLLREIKYREKSCVLAICDTLLLPMNTVFGNRKITLNPDNTWLKDKQVKGPTWFFFAHVITLVFSPIICLAACYKLHSGEHSSFLRMYQISKKRSFFYEQGWTVKNIDRTKLSAFTFVVEKAKNELHVPFKNSGKLLYKDFLLTHSILCKG